MALFILIFLIINNCLLSLLGSEQSSSKVLEIKSSILSADQNIGFYKVDETLNLTCIFKNESTLPDVVLEWIIPSKASNRVIYQQGTSAVLVIENLQENDSGEYKCKAIHNGTPFFSSESSVRIKVKNKKKECTDVMFQCTAGICIHKRYTCDGFSDCPQGEDESPGYCGPGNPCDNKLMCPDYRCIPFTWCCESHREPNCTTKVKHSCCAHVEKLTRDVDNELGFQFEQQRFSDMGILQTTVYTVIGCAMAFMFIVTIIVIAICRVHVRRTLLSRCPTATRNLALGRGTTVHENNLGGWSVYDLDRCLNRSRLGGNDLVSVNPLLVTYNINNGVQIVGRPVDPPPYCEIVTCPPKEGPPPPYASQENIYLLRENKSQEAETEATNMSSVEPEATETDVLLAASSQNISVISCNAMDVVTSTEEFLVASAFETVSKHSENVLKEPSDSEFFCDSSQCFAEINKFDESKNCNANIVVVGNRCSESAGTLKVQTGESSSYVTGNVDISKGAVQKLYSTKSLDSNFRRKGKTFSINPNKRI